jgi:hypothetical protein
MLKVGVQTKGILPNMPVDKGFQFIKDAGFEKVDLSIDTFLKIQIYTPVMLIDFLMLQ